MKKKIVAIYMSFIVVIGLLVGCSKNKLLEQEVNSESEITVDVTKQKPEEKEDLVHLRLIMYGTTSDRREEYYKNEFHDRVLEALNIDLTVEWLPWSEMFGATMVSMLASGESMAFQNIPASNDWTAKGYVAEISMEDIEAYMPDYLDMRGIENNFKACTQQGKIVAIPMGNKAYAGDKQCITIRNDLLNEVGYDAADIHSLDKFNEAIAAVKQKYPDITVFSEPKYLYRAFAKELGNITIAETRICITDQMVDDDKIYSYYESDVFKNGVKMFEDWVDRGWITEEYLINPEKNIADWNAGNALVRFGTASALIEEPEYALINIADTRYVKTRDYDWALSFSTNSTKDIPHWLKLINWMYKDLETYNFCIYGVEGKDWEYAEDGTIHKLVNDEFVDDWFMDASKYRIYNSEISQKRIEEYENFDYGSKMSKMNGFTFDATNVQTEIALINAVIAEYVEPLSYGFMDFDQDYEMILGKLKEAGLNEYVAEYQRQFSEWYAVNNESNQ